MLKIILLILELVLTKIVSLFLLGMAVFTALICRSDKQEISMLAKTGYQIIDDKVFFYPGFTASNGFEIKDADLNTFRILGEWTGEISYVDYAKDKNQVYCNGLILRQADARTFDRIKPLYAKDANHIFYAHHILSDDPTHFEFMKAENLARDNYHVYRSNRIISDSPSGFEILESGHGGYYRDDLGIIVGTSRLRNADPDTFDYIGGDYSKDSKTVFLIESTRRSEVLGADPATFRLITEYYTKDKNKIYWLGECLSDADPTRFQVINEEFHCSHDGRYAYHRNIIIPNANPVRFPDGKQCKYCDENKVVFED